MKKKLVYGLIALFALSFVFTGCENGTTDTVYVGENLVPGIPITTKEGLNAALALKPDWTAANPETYAVYSNAELIDYFGTNKYKPVITAPGVAQGQQTSIVPDGVILNLSGAFRVGSAAGGGHLKIGGEVNVWKGAELIAGTYTSNTGGTGAFGGTITIGVATVDIDDTVTVNGVQVKYPKRNARGRLNVYENGILTTNGIPGGTANMTDLVFASIYSYNTQGHDDSEFRNPAAFTNIGGIFDWTLNPETPGYPESNKHVWGGTYSEPLGGSIGLPVQNQMVVHAFGDGTITGLGKDSSGPDNRVLYAPSDARLTFAANSYFNVGGASDSFVRLQGSSYDVRSIANGLFKTNLILPSDLPNIEHLTIREGTKVYAVANLTGNLTVNGTLFAGTDGISGKQNAIGLNTGLYNIDVGPKGYFDATGIHTEGIGGDAGANDWVTGKDQFNELKSLRVQADNLNYGKFYANGANVAFKELEGTLEIDGHAEIALGKFPKLNTLVVNGNNSLYTGTGGTAYFYQLKSLTVNGYYNAGTATDFRERNLEGVITNGDEALNTIRVGNGGYLWANGAEDDRGGKYSNFDKVTAINIDGRVPAAYIKGFGPPRSFFPLGYPGTRGIIAIAAAPGMASQDVYPEQRKEFGVIVSDSATFAGLGSGATVVINGFAQLDNVNAFSTVRNLTVGGVFKSANAALPNLETVAVNGGYLYSGAAGFGKVTAGNATGNGTLDLTGNASGAANLSILGGTVGVAKVIALPSASYDVSQEILIPSGTWTANGDVISSGGKVILGDGFSTPEAEGTLSTTLTIASGGNLTLGGSSAFTVGSTGVINLNGALTIAGGTLTLDAGSNTTLNVGSGAVLTVSGEKSTFVGTGATINVNGGKIVFAGAGTGSLGGTVTLTGGAILDGLTTTTTSMNTFDWLGTASTIKITGDATIKGKDNPNRTILVAPVGFIKDQAADVGPFITLGGTANVTIVKGDAGSWASLSIDSPVTLGPLPASSKGPDALVINAPVTVIGNAYLGGTTTIGTVGANGSLVGSPGATLTIPNGGTFRVPANTANIWASGTGALGAVAGTYSGYQNWVWKALGTTGTDGWVAGGTGL